VNSRDYLDQLRSIETSLRSAAVQNAMRSQDQASKDRFVEMRQDLAERIGQLTIAELDSLDRAFTAQDDDIEAGITAAQGSIAKLDNIAQVLDHIGAVLKVATKVAGALR
jgi:hypothetical protein